MRHAAALGDASAPPRRRRLAEQTPTKNNDVVVNNGHVVVKMDVQRVCDDGDDVDVDPRPLRHHGMRVWDAVALPRTLAISMSQARSQPTT